MSDKLRRPSLALPMLLLVVLCAGVRVAFWHVYSTQTFGDTGTYLELASEIAHLDFSDYQGRRTPVYPLLLAVAQLDYNMVWLIQSLLGVGISVLLFFLVLEIVPSAGLAFVVGLFHSLTLNQLFYEANILAETLSTFLVVASVLLVFRATRTAAGLRLALMVGLCTAAATLGRPQYVYLGPAFAIVLLIAGRGGDWKRVAAFVMAFAIPVFGWAAFNKVTVNTFGLSTQIGLSLAQHSGKFMDKAPDEYATLRDIYMKHRAQMPADADHMSIWEAIPDMLQTTGLPFIELNRQLTRLSIQLIASHPGLYLRSVAGAWYSFWPVPNTWKLEDISGPRTRRALETIWSVEHVALRLMNLVLVVAAPSLALRAMFQRFRNREENDLLVLAAVVLGGSVIQALLEATDNARYSIPTQSLVVVFVVVLGFLVMQRRPARSRTAIDDSNELRTAQPIDSLRQRP